MWTQSDLLNVKEAIMKLATGARIVTVSFSVDGGSDRKTEFQPAQLHELKKLYSEIESSLQEDATTAYVATSFKGVF
ncbi:hypothetical protein EYS14_03405 [Alteromonadaceae bacterium M269]|nr:hypothetical protein EYS14_03405 [Alteromonadaceae bacterium M269]